MHTLESVDQSAETGARVDSRRRAARLDVPKPAQQHHAREATLSVRGVGGPPGSPSLGTLIRVGNDYLFSGEWWITLFPGAVLGVLALSVNLFGDWLRDALNPRLG